MGLKIQSNGAALIKSFCSGCESPLGSPPGGTPGRPDEGNTLAQGALKPLLSLAAGLLALSVAAFWVCAMLGWAGGVPRSA